MNNRHQIPADIFALAQGLQSAVRRYPPKPTTHRQGTIERYERLRPILEPLVRDGLTQWGIAYVLSGLGIETPGGGRIWKQRTVHRALAVLKLRTKGQVNLGVGVK